jgi:hypothetical protein
MWNLALAILGNLLVFVHGALVVSYALYLRYNIVLYKPGPPNGYSNDPLGRWAYYSVDDGPTRPVTWNGWNAGNFAAGTIIGTASYFSTYAYEQYWLQRGWDPGWKGVVLGLRIPIPKDQKRHSYGFRFSLSAWFSTRFAMFVLAWSVSGVMMFRFLGRDVTLNDIFESRTTPTLRSQMSQMISRDDIERYFLNIAKYRIGSIMDPEKEFPTNLQIGDTTYSNYSESRGVGVPIRPFIDFSKSTAYADKAVRLSEGNIPWPEFSILKKFDADVYSTDVEVNCRDVTKEQVIYREEIVSHGPEILDALKVYVVRINSKRQVEMGDGGRRDRAMASTLVFSTTTQTGTHDSIGTLTMRQNSQQLPEWKQIFFLGELHRREQDLEKKLPVIVVECIYKARDNIIHARAEPTSGRPAVLHTATVFS